MKRVASGILPMIAIDRTAPKALHRQIYDAYRAAITEGRLRPGQRIPSTRIFAAEVGVSRFPVLGAYGQLLAEGYIESRVGAGTVVSASLPDQSPPKEATRARGLPTRSGPRPVGRWRRVPTLSIAAVSWLNVMGAFRLGQVAFDEFPHQIWNQLVARHSRGMNIQSAHYGGPMGGDGLRRAIAGYLKTARSVHCEPEQVMIVNGSQQALDMATRVILDPGSRVWMEEPGYRLARDVFLLNGCHLVPVPVNGEGLDVRAGIRKSRKARAAFVSPSHQFPLGVTMSAARRLQLLDWAQSAGAWILEDDYDSEYRYESKPIAALQGLDSNARVIYVGSFSKVVFPSLRLGYIVIPTDLIEHFISVRRLMDLGPPTFHQQVLADFIEEGHLARHIRRTRLLYAERRRALVEGLQGELGDLLELVGDDAGMHVAARLRNRASDVEVSEQAARQGISLWPLSPSYVRERPPQGFILGFSGVTTSGIAQAVRKLGSLLHRN